MTDHILHISIHILLTLQVLCWDLAQVRRQLNNSSCLRWWQGTNHMSYYNIWCHCLYFFTGFVTAWEDLDDIFVKLALRYLFWMLRVLAGDGLQMF
jgi:hypothetical protein